MYTFYVTVTLPELKDVCIDSLNWDVNPFSCLWEPSSLSISPSKEYI